jgi:hypothetical protein
MTGEVTLALPGGSGAVPPRRLLQRRNCGGPAALGVFGGAIHGSNLLARHSGQRVIRRPLVQQPTPAWLLSGEHHGRQANKLARRDVGRSTEATQAITPRDQR